MRTFLILFGIVLAVFAGGIFWMFSGADDVLQHAVERIGSASLGSRVHVKKVDIDVISGEITLKGLEVANPAGFADGPAIVVDKTTVVMAHEVGKGGLPVLSSVVIEAPRIAYETGDGGSNLATLLANARAHAQSGAAATPAAASEDGVPPPRLVIQDLYIHGGRVTLNGQALEPLEDIHLSNLGGETGATAAALLPPTLAAVLAGIDRIAKPGG